MIRAIAHATEATGAPLAPEGLRSLVDGLARTPGLWTPRVRHDPDERVFERLWLDDLVEVWLICWSGEEHDTGFHDHDISSGAFAVVRGALRGGAPGDRPHHPAPAARGAVAGLPALARAPRPRRRRHARRVDPRLLATARAALGVYAVSDDGALGRETVSASHELRADSGPLTDDRTTMEEDL